MFQQKTWKEIKFIKGDCCKRKRAQKKIFSDKMVEDERIQNFFKISEKGPKRAAKALPLK